MLWVKLIDKLMDPRATCLCPFSVGEGKFGCVLAAAPAWPKNDGLAQSWGKEQFPDLIQMGFCVFFYAYNVGKNKQPMQAFEYYKCF